MKHLGYARTLRGLLGVAALAFAGQLAALEKADTVRIGTVAYASAGKTEYYGLSTLIDSDPQLKRELQARGTRIEWVPAPTASVGTFINEAFANGRVDLALYGDLPSIILNASGVQTRLLAAYGSGNNVYLVVPVNSSATSIDDLKGKRIALHRGRPWELPFAKLLESRQLEFKDFRIFNLNPQAGAAALSAGRVDGFFTLNDAFLLEDKQVGKIIWSSKQAPLDWKMRAELFGAADFVEREPEITQLVVDAYVRALRWAGREENKDAYLALLAKTGLPESVLRREFDGAPWAEHFSPQVDDVIRKHYADAIAYGLESRLIRQGLDLDRFIDNRFLDKALEQPQSP